MPNPFHVADLIQGELERRGWTLDDLKRESGADAAGCLSLDMIQLRDPRLILGERTADLLAKVFDKPADFWVSFDESWRLLVNDTA